MRRRILPTLTRSALGAAIALFFMAASAQAVLLTFEDVPGGSIQGTLDFMPTYQGFDFSGTLVWIDLVGSSWPYGAHSGEFAILNQSSGVGTITEQSGADFTFDGLWAKKWATLPESGGLNSLFGTLEGYNNGGLVWSLATGLNGSYQFFGPQGGAIDELRLGFGNNFLVDDISLTVVPEPSLAFLLSSYLIGLAMRRRS